jgi:hypothetical protein
MQFRRQCKEVKLRNTFYRLINKDFFTAERMFRYRMTESPNVNRCGEIETVDHLLFECNDSKKMWKTYNTVLKRKLSSRYEINGKKIFLILK